MNSKEVCLMKKIEDNLTKDEKILIKAEQSNLMLIIGGVITVVCLLINWVLALLFVILIYRAWIVSYLTNNLCITNKRIYGSVGLIKKEELDMPIKSINSISISKGLFGSIFGYSKLTISSHGDGWTFPFLKNANEIKKVFYENQ